MISYSIILTNKADEDEASIFQYISNEFGIIYAEKFREKLMRFFHLLSKQPFIGRSAKNYPTLRVYIFNQQNKIVYKIENDTIIIIRLLHIKSRLSSKY